MQEQLNNIEKILITQGKKIDRMDEALIGNEYTDNKGMMHQVKENTSFIKKAKKTNYIVIGLAMGLGVLKLGWSTVLKFFMLG